MRNAGLVLSNLPRCIAVILLAGFCTLAAGGAVAQLSPVPPAPADGHLDGLSQADLTQLLNGLKREAKFTRDSIKCFKAFKTARKNGERAAAAASTPGTAQDWVNRCLGKLGWGNLTTAGSTDRYGNVRIASEGGNTSISPLQAAWNAEQRRITVVHEASHVQSRKADAKKAGIDFNKWKEWGKLKEKMDEFLADSSLSPEQLGHALTDLGDFEFRNGGRTASEGRYMAGQAATHFTEVEIKLIKWSYQNRVGTARFLDLTTNPVRSANEEIREYSHHLAFLKTRIAAISARLTTANLPRSGTQTPPPGTQTPPSGSATPGNPKTGTPQTPKTETPKEPKTATPHIPKTETPKTETPKTPKTETPKSTSQAPGGYDGQGDPGSCFAGGTRVAMADGSHKNIEDVRIGEKVRGKDGAINTVTGIERPKLGKRLLYAINGGRAFVTAEHPFWTPAGWKSIDPRATFAENPRLRVGALAVGDRIAMIAASTVPSLAAAGAGVVAVSYAPASLRSIAIRSILGVPGDPGTKVYNLLLDGNHSYFADGYLVHNKG